MGTLEYEAALQLREEVLRAPLELPLSNDDLADESLCAHLGGFDEGRLVAILLLKPLNQHTVKMRQVAVQPGLQGRGIGAKLVAFAEAFARERGYKTMIAHARAAAVEFYRGLGYATSGEPFIETTIPHILVSKSLPPAPWRG
jgi:predicted GNAT family N-acyltransferase